MAHKPSKHKTSITKKYFTRDTIPPHFKTIHTIPYKKQNKTKTKNSSMYVATKSTPSRTSTYERSFTHEGDYLVTVFQGKY